MFDVCYNCDGKFIEFIGNIKGYWGDKEIEFVNLPGFKCDNCDEVYLDEDIAVLTQEITRAFYDIDAIPKIVDISNCYELLLEHLDEIYEIITKKRIKMFVSNGKVVLYKKDLISLFNNHDIMFAARNVAINKVGPITDDVYGEIKKLL